MPGASGAIKSGSCYVEILAKDNALTRSFRSISGRLKSLGGSMTNMGKGLMVGMTPALTAMGGALKLYTSMGGKIAEVSAKTGASASDITALGYAADQSESSFEALASGLIKMNKNIGELKNGSKSAKEAFGKIGVSLKDLDGLDTTESFFLLAKGIRLLGEETLQTEAAMDLFGKGGTELLPLLQQESEAISRLMQSAHALGISLSTEEVRAANEFGDSLSTIWQQVKKLIFVIGSQLAASLQVYIADIQRALAASIRWIQTHKGLVVLIAKIAVCVFAAGAALVGLGLTLTVVGKAFGAIATAVVLMGGGLGKLGAIAGKAGKLMVAGFLLLPKVLNALPKLITFLAAGITRLGGLLARIPALAAVVGRALLVAFSMLGTPIGAVALALTTLTIVLLSTTDAWSQLVNWMKSSFSSVANYLGSAVDWLGTKFASLADIFGKSIGAIGNALSNGNLSAAANVLWLGLKASWLTGTNALMEIWIGFKRAFSETIATIAYGGLALFEEAWAGLSTAWENLTSGLAAVWVEWNAIVGSAFIKTVGFLSEVWSKFISGLKIGWSSYSDWMSKKMLDLYKVWDDCFGDGTFDVELAKSMVDKEGEAYRSKTATDSQADINKNNQNSKDTLSALEAKRQEKLAAIGKANAARLIEIEKNKQDALLNIGKADSEEKTQREKEFAKQLANSNKELADAKKAWSEAVDKANLDPDSGFKQEFENPPEEPYADFQRRGVNKSETKGLMAYNSYGLKSLGAGSASDPVARNTQVMINEQKKTNKLLAEKKGVGIPVK